MLVFNYTGDRLNFGLATEQARREGRKVRAIGHLGLGTCSWAFGLGFLLYSRMLRHLALGFLLYLGYLDMDTCTCTWVSIIFLDVSAFERGMKGPVNLALWLSGAQLFVSHSVFMGACFGYKVSQPYSFGSILWTLGVLSCLWGHLHFFRGVKACYEEWVQEKLKSNKTMGFGQRVS